MNPVVTIFVSTYNRLDTLSRTLDSYRKFYTPYEVVIVDNGTDHPDCLALLSEVEERPEVRDIIALKKIPTIFELHDNITIAMKDRYKQKPCPKWFAVTDADICFDGSHPDTLAKYIDIFKETEDAPGPHTRVDASIPAGYPLRSRILATESRPLYKSSMRLAAGAHVSSWSIDTTFHLFPATPEFRRFQMDTIRVGPPYDAMHLDWYSDILHPTRENEIYIGDPRKISSWGNGWIGGFWREFQQDPELAYRNMLASAERNNQNDLKNELFMVSWCLQYGHGVERNELESAMRLDQAIPANSPYIQHRDDWLEMIYRNNFQSLGWDDA